LRLDGFSRRRTTDRGVGRRREMLQSDFDRRRSRRAIALLIGTVLVTPLVIGYVIYCRMR
jgi:hypothetical protein